MAIGKPPPTDTFFEAGFLSNDIEKMRSKTMEDNAELFGYSQILSVLLQEVACRSIAHIREDPLHPKVISTTLLLRSLASFQAFILLCERGMLTDARTIARGILENSFYHAALIEHPEQVIESLRAGHVADGKNFAASIRKMDARGISEGILKDMEESLKKFPASKKKNVQGLASLTPLDRGYFLYRILSGDSAHTTIQSLGKHITLKDRAKKWIEFQWGPSGKGEIAETLCRGFEAMGSVAVCHAEIVEDRAGHLKLSSIIRKYDESPTVRKVPRPPYPPS